MKIKDITGERLFSLGNIVSVVTVIVAIIIYTQATFATKTDLMQYRATLEQRLESIQSDVKYLIRLHIAENK